MLLEVVLVFAAQVFEGNTAVRQWPTATGKTNVALEVNFIMLYQAMIAEDNVGAIGRQTTDKAAPSMARDDAARIE
jgi:hypothetical protein